MTMIRYLSLGFFGVISALAVQSQEEYGYPENHHEMMAKRTFLESKFPLPCATACLYIDIVWGGCSEMQYTWACEMHCSPFNYTRAVNCLECRVANGDPELDSNQAQLELKDWNEACASVNPREDQNGNRNWTATSSITAVPTTTGPFSTSVEGTGEIPISVWTGLQDYVTVTVFPAIPSGSEQAGSETGSSVSDESQSSPSITSSVASATDSPNSGQVVEVGLAVALICVIISLAL